MSFWIENAYANIDEDPLPYVGPASSLAGDYDPLLIGAAVLAGLILLYFIIIRPLMKRKSKPASSSETARAAHAETEADTETADNPATPPKATLKGKVFLSYRRNDSADVSGRIYDRLSANFGEDNIFKDVDSIPLGVDFREYIDSMIKESAVVLVVIGNEWFGSSADTGKRRIDDPRDFVRMEVAVALQRGVNIIPLLVRKAQMPDEKDLPEELKSLAYRNGISIRPDPDFNNDIDRLVYGIRKIISSAVDSKSTDAGG
ncbi:MAG: TIR domain-containing protein [Thiolinea sp.]